MKYIIPTFGLSIAVCLAGCNTTRSTIATTRDDRNGDGKTDRIWFSYLGSADRDYGFMDEDFDGFFELKRTQGVAVFEEEIAPPLELSEIENEHPEQ
ncbi:hypothetical protein P3T73_07305 [Kiritimatiellota bacterium B12222]|nr:hypothetical protein P3T73_07305 [Kiritimatiellota bacterium B12222]